MSSARCSYDSGRRNRTNLAGAGVFQDAGVGIEAGTPEHSGVAETSVLRCRFLRCTRAGASLRNFNSLDWWFRQCRFEDCQTGLTNLYGAGNFYAYDSVFLRSSDADIPVAGCRRSNSRRS